MEAVPALWVHYSEALVFQFPRFVVKSPSPQGLEIESNAIEARPLAARNVKQGVRGEEDTVMPQAGNYPEPQALCLGQEACMAVLSIGRDDVESFCKVRSQPSQFPKLLRPLL